MAYKYQWLQDINDQKIKALGFSDKLRIINDAFLEDFAHELTYKEACLLSAIENETHGNIEKARQDYETADQRQLFLLGMINAAWVLAPDEITDEQHKALVNMAYGRNY